MDAMIQWVEALLGNAYASVIALVGLVTVILRLLSRVSVLHDRHVVLKVLERRRKLRKATVEGTPLASYLDTSIQTETFRIASGISASPQKMEYLLKLSSLGRWDDSQLRSISRHLRQEPDSAEPCIQIDRSSSIDAVVCVVGGFYFIFAGLFFLVSSGIYLPSPLGWLIGAATCLVLFVCALGMWKGFLDYLIAKRAKAYLDCGQSRGEQGATA